MYWFNIYDDFQSDAFPFIFSLQNKIIKTEFLEHKKTITTKKPTVFGEKIFHATIYDLK